MAHVRVYYTLLVVMICILFVKLRKCWSVRACLLRVCVPVRACVYCGYVCRSVCMRASVCVWVGGVAEEWG